MDRAKLQRYQAQARTFLSSSKFLHRLSLQRYQAQARTIARRRFKTSSGSPGCNATRLKRELHFYNLVIDGAHLVATLPGSSENVGRSKLYDDAAKGLQRYQAQARTSSSVGSEVCCSSCCNATRLKRELTRLMRLKENVRLQRYQAQARTVARRPKTPVKSVCCNATRLKRELRIVQ